MVSTDPIADMLTRIRNAINSGQSQISLPHSKLKETVARILADSGFVQAVATSEHDSRKRLDITINSADSNAVITEINRLSRPGRRLYVNSKGIPNIKRGRGIVVISTSQGVMTGQKARTKRLGGELICEVY